MVATIANDPQDNAQGDIIGIVIDTVPIWIDFHLTTDTEHWSTVLSATVVRIVSESIDTDIDTANKTIHRYLDKRKVDTTILATTSAHALATTG